MNKDFLYFLQALQEIDKKYFRYNPHDFHNKEPLFLSLLKWTRYTIDYNKDHLPKLMALRKDLLLIGLEVTDIEEEKYGYKMVISLPKNPTLKLLYEDT